MAMIRKKANGPATRVTVLSVAGAILLCSSHARSADGPRAEEGRRAFQAGVILLKDPDGAKYEDALAQFKKAYLLLGSWKILGNMGLCALKVERDGEAIEAYEKYLAGGGKEIDPDERAQVERDLAALKAQVVKVHLDFPSAPVRISDNRTTTQGGHVVNDYEAAGTSVDLAIHPGHHTITASSTGAPPWDVILNPGGTGSHRFIAPAARSEGSNASGRRTAGFLVGGAGVVGLAVGGYFGLRTFSQKNDAEPYCQGTQCTQPGVDFREQAKSSATISTIAFGLGAAAVGVGIVLIVTSRSTSKEAPAVASSAASSGPSLRRPAMWMAPSVGPSAGGLSIEGVF